MSTEVLRNCNVVRFSSGDTLVLDTGRVLRCTDAAYATASSLFRRGALTLTVEAGLVVSVALVD